MPFFIQMLDGRCERSETLPELGGFPAIGGGVSIASSVGRNGANLFSDVVTIQDALNRVPVDSGGAHPTLKMDGLCGPKSRKAIGEFQLNHFGWKGSDGLVEPHKQTIFKLNEILGGSPMFGDAQIGVGGTTSSRYAPDINTAREHVQAAQANMLAASQHLTVSSSLGGVSIREHRMRLLNEHFALDSRPDKRQAFNFVLYIYHLMHEVFQRPGGLWGYAMFEPDPLNLHKRHPRRPYGYTFSGGYFKGGQTRTYGRTKIRLDTIYLTGRFPEMHRDRRSFGIVHELAHFVSNAPTPISDYAYNVEGKGVRVRSLPLSLKPRNAENYANFAFAADTGRKPPNY